MRRYIQSSVSSILDEPVEVRIAVARDMNARESALVSLANDTDERVRFWVAKNPNTPQDVANAIPLNGVELIDQQYYIYLDLSVEDTYDSVLGQHLFHIIKDAVVSAGAVFEDAYWERYGIGDDEDINCTVCFDAINGYDIDTANAILSALNAAGFRVIDTEWGI